MMEERNNLKDRLIEILQEAVSKSEQKAALDNEIAAQNKVLFELQIDAKDRELAAKDKEIAELKGMFFELDAKDKEIAELKGMFFELDAKVKEIAELNGKHFNNLCKDSSTSTGGGGIAPLANRNLSAYI
jgi:hypothetical protein